MDEKEAKMTDLENEISAVEVKARTGLTADEALALLRAGKPLEGVRVERLKLRGEFPLPITIKNCTLVRPDFERAVFQAEVAIVGSTLDRPSFGHASEFQKGLNLSGSTLNKVTFPRLTVRGTLNLSNAVARGKLLCTKCRFDGRVRGWELCVAGWLDFKECTFADEVDLRSIHVDQGVNLAKCRFAGDLLLR